MDKGNMLNYVCLYIYLFTYVFMYWVILCINNSEFFCLQNKPCSCFINIW